MKKIKRNNPLFLLLIIFSQLLSACASKEEVASNLNAEQAIEVLLSLKHAGISAEKIKSGSGKNEKYLVTVPADDYLKSIEILHEFNLPKKETETVEALTAQEGFAPNIKEISSLRLDRALALETERLIQGLAGIVDARVVIRSNLVSPEQLNLNPNQPAVQNKAKATVVLKFNTIAPNLSQNTEQKIRSIITQIVPTINADDILITSLKVNLDTELKFGSLPSADGKSEIMPLAQVDLLPIIVPVQQKNQVRAFLVVLMGIFVFCGIFIGWWLGFLFKKPKQLQSKGPKTAILEANFTGQAVLPGGNPGKIGEISKE